MYKVDSEVRVVATPPMENIHRGFVFYKKERHKINHVPSHLFMFHSVHHRIQIHI